MRQTSLARATELGPRRAGAFLALLLSSLAAASGLASCSFDRSDRWQDNQRSQTVPEVSCDPGEQRCTSGLERCVQGLGGPEWQSEDDCAARGQSCASVALGCTPCAPDTTRCDGFDVLRCDATGQTETVSSTCAGDQGDACRDGNCTNLCAAAASTRSNVGCEYWAVDLDNAMIDDSLNAAAQQFAVVVSNPQPDLSARITIVRDDTLPGEPGAPIDVASAEIPPLSLRVFKLGPREVDGSPEGEFNTGSHTALTRAAYRLQSDVPVVAYQFNPLENANVFSNDASLLKPTEALTANPGTMEPAYVVLGWPQTIASTEDPNTNFNPVSPIDLRSFLTLVGTRDGTRVKVTTKAKIVAGGPVPEVAIDGSVELTLDAFDVLNLETDDFAADFSGSLIETDQPVVVFSGGEASDAPAFDTLSSRRCCADHLEEQLDPIRTAGRQFVAAVPNSRTRAVSSAGAAIGVIEEPQYFRVIAARETGAVIETSLPGKLAQIVLTGRGDFADIETTRDFQLVSDHPIMLGHVSPSQNAAGVPRGLPGGDPSFLVVPPIEQFRANYIFLTPDKYAFDFVRIVAPRGATVLLDGQDVAAIPDCETVPGDGLSPDERGAPNPSFVVHRCQLSFPIIDPALDAVERLQPGFQNDGVHRVDADQKVGVLVDGFDSFVSYAYAGGTQLETVPVL